MSKLKVKLIKRNVRALLKSQEVMQECEEWAQIVAARCGDGFEVNTYVGKKRVNAEVRAETREARRRAMKDNVLLKGLKQ